VPRVQHEPRVQALYCPSNEDWRRGGLGETHRNQEEPWATDAGEDLQRPVLEEEEAGHFFPA